MSAADPMLQGTYLQDDSTDFPSSSKELDDFESRLSGGRPARAPAVPHTRGAAAPPHSTGKTIPRTTPPQFAPAGGAARRRMSEEETDAQQQRQEDIDAVRELGTGEIDSD